MRDLIVKLSLWIVLASIERAIVSDDASVIHLVIVMNCWSLCSGSRMESLPGVHDVELTLR